MRRCPGLVCVLVCLLAGVACGGKVLVFPGEFSHWLNMRSIIDELVRRNHTVTVLVPDSSPSVRHQDPGLRSKFNFIVFKVPFSRTEVHSFLLDSLNFLINESHNSSLWTMVQFFRNWVRKTVEFQTHECVAMTKDPSVLEQIRAAAPDVVLYDPIAPCGDLVASLLDVPLVISLRLSVGSVMERVCGHAPYPPSYVPILPTSDHMTFLERTTNVLGYALSHVFITQFWWANLDPLYSEVLGRPTSVCSALGRADIWLIRTYWDIETPRPLPPNFHYVGGLHCKPANPLPPDLEEFVSSADAGVVVVTFGSMVTNLTTERADVIAAALAQLPQKVIWRYSGLTPNTLGSNTKLFDWIPQNDLLGHPKTRAFVTHGGTNGLYEAVYHGVPLVGVPLFGDQSDNLARLTRRHAAIVLHFNTMTSQEMTSAINDVINDPSYKQSMLSVSSIHRERPLSALQEAVFWVEFVMRNGGAPHLRLRSHDLTWLQYHSLDVAAFLLVVMTTAIIATATCLKLGLRVGLRLVRGPKTHQD